MFDEFKGRSRSLSKVAYVMVEVRVCELGQTRYEDGELVYL